MIRRACYVTRAIVEGRSMFYVCLPSGRVWGEYRRKADAVKRARAINRESARAEKVRL